MERVTHPTPTPSRTEQAPHCGPPHSHDHENHGDTSRRKMALRFAKEFLGGGHHHEPHDSHESHPPEAPLVSRWWGVKASLGNLGVGAFEMASAVGNKLTLAALDAGHNLGDGTYAFQARSLEHPNPKRQAILEGLSRAALFASSVSMLAMSGLSLKNGAAPHRPDVWAMASVSASATLNAYLFAGPLKKLRQRRKQLKPLTSAEEGLLWHGALDMAHVGAAAAGLALSTCGLGGIEKGAGAIIGSVGVWVFRPKRGQFRSPKGESHSLSAPETFPKQRTKQRVARLALAATAAAGAVFGIHGVLHEEAPALPTQSAKVNTAPADTVRSDIPHPKLSQTAGVRPVTVARGEGWYEVFQELDLKPAQWQETLRAAGPWLRSQHVAYKEAGEFRITKPGKLPPRVTQKILQFAAA